MRKIPVLRLFLFLSVSSLLWQCASLQMQTNIKSKKIPESYALQDSLRDTLSIARINWRDYFGDILLIQLVDTALANNPNLQMALQRIEVARAYRKQTTGTLLPQVSANVNGSIRKFGLYTMDGAGNIVTEITPGRNIPIDLPDISIGLQATWEVDIWKKLRNQRKASTARYLAGIEGKNFVKSNLVTDVATAYYQLIALDNELDAIREFSHKQQENLHVMQLQKESGRINELALQQFRALLLGAQGMEHETLQKITETENLIHFLLGRYPQPIPRHKKGLFDEMPKEIVAGIPSQLLDNRPDIRGAALQILASKLDLAAARAAFLPRFTINAGVGFQAFDPTYLFLSPASLAYSALGGLVAPLINRNALKAEFNIAKAHQVSAMYTYQENILNGFREVRNELSNIARLQEIRKLKEQQSIELTNAVSTAIQLYRTSKATYVEVLLAQQNALHTTLELINTAKRQRMATVSIYKALGGGWRETQ